ncbi:hypothetical protein L6452_06329 [Arctium lappa]|uniref:Uncharacterized protein n=1 Tax=Arctium lappa TaxID=4217 RepID=A0ACB9EJW3_ARCLA|nr:hypothetical protein L6452_06329 [Arctium lappa]
MGGSKMLLKELKTENIELKRKTSDLENQIVQIQQADSVDSYTEKIKNLEYANDEFNKKITDMELQMVKDRDDFEKEKKEFAKKFLEEKFAKEKKTIEQKNIGIFKEISGQRNNVDNGFEEEIQLFETEIKKLTEKLSELSTRALKE